MTYARGEMNTLNEKIITETEKLKVEQAQLAKERAKLDETRKTLTSEKEKLEKLEAQDKELARKQQEMKERIDVQEKKLGELKTAREKMDDPAYLARIQSSADIENVLPPDLRQDFASKYPAPKQTLPDTDPSAQRVVSTTPVPSSPAATKPETGITAASGLGDGPASLKDDNKLQVAFNQAAPNTKPAEPASTPATPNLDEDKKLAVKAPVAAAPVV